MKKIFGILLVGLFLVSVFSDSDKEERIKKFKEKYGEDIEILWNDKANQPKFISGNIDIFIGKERKEIKTKEKADSVSREFIQENYYFFSIYISTLVTSNIVYKEEKNRYYITYDQLYNGLPVFSSSIVVSLDTNGVIKAVNSNYHYNINISTNATVLEDQAKNIAIQHLDLTSEQLENSTLGISEINGEYKLVWKIEFVPQSSRKDNVCLIDAQTGEVLRSYSTVVETNETTNNEESKAMTEYLILLISILLCILVMGIFIRRRIK